VDNKHHREKLLAPTLETEFRFLVLLLFDIILTSSSTHSIPKMWDIFWKDISRHAMKVDSRSIPHLLESNKNIIAALLELTDELSPFVILQYHKIPPEDMYKVVETLPKLWTNKDFSQYAKICSGTCIPNYYFLIDIFNRTIL
jgi:hypothetical protein